MTCVALDITRLLHAPLSRTPRGIDRVEMAYAEHFLSASAGDNCAVVPTLLGTRWLDRAQALKILRAIENVWRETIYPDADPVYRAARHWLLTGEKHAHSRGGLSKTAHFVGAASRILGSFRSFGRSMRELPPNSIYLNVGHYGLSFPGHLRWLESRRDVIPVFMLHDAIPLESPQFVSARESRGHRRRFELTAQLARVLITNSDASREQIGRHLSLSSSNERLKTVVLSLPVGSQFLEPIEADDDLTSVPYFMICGAIGPRKNQTLLLDVWRSIVAEGGPVPKLVVAGVRRSSSPNFTKRWEALLRDDLLAPHVHEIEGLSTPGLCRLLAHARASLMPSFTEGFGLPVAEALALGTPVIASDISAHREAGGSAPTYLAPSDAAAWFQAVRAHAGAPIRLPRVGSTWRGYFAQLEAFLR